MMKVDDSFNYCVTGENMKYWDDINDCRRSDEIDQLNYSTASQYYIWQKKHHEVSGIGYECMKRETVWTYESSFFGEKYKSSIVKNIPLTKEECMVMVVTKKCEKDIMECMNNVCTVFPCRSLHVKKLIILAFLHGNVKSYTCLSKILVLCMPKIQYI